MVILFTEDEDYKVENSSIQVLVPGGKTCASFDVNIVDDVIVESKETFNVSIDPLSLPYGIVLGNITTAEVVILDDDGKFRLLYVTGFWKTVPNRTFGISRNTYFNSHGTVFLWCRLAPVVD